MVKPIVFLNICLILSRLISSRVFSSYSQSNLIDYDYSNFSAVLALDHKVKINYKDKIFFESKNLLFNPQNIKDIRLFNKLNEELKLDIVLSSDSVIELENNNFLEEDYNIVIYMNNYYVDSSSYNNNYLILFIESNDQQISKLTYSNIRNSKLDSIISIIYPSIYNSNHTSLFINDITSLKLPLIKNMNLFNKKMFSNIKILIKIYSKCLSISTKLQLSLTDDLTMTKLPYIE